MNEALEYFRPYDIRGKPMPWKLNQKKLTYSDIDSNNQEIVLEQAKNKVLEWSLFQCGLLNDNREIAGMIEPDMLNQIKHERLERMIINEVINKIYFFNLFLIQIYEQEEKWVCYDDYENVLCLEISDLLLDDLFSETGAIFSKIIK